MSAIVAALGNNRAEYVAVRPRVVKFTFRGEYIGVAVAVKVYAHYFHREVVVGGYAPLYVYRGSVVAFFRRGESRPHVVVGIEQSEGCPIAAGIGCRHGDGVAGNLCRRRLIVVAARRRVLVQGAVKP